MCSCIYIPCQVNGDGAISGIAVVCVEEVIVGAILTAYYDVHKRYSHCSLFTVYIPALDRK